MLRDKVQPSPMKLAQRLLPLVLLGGMYSQGKIKMAWGVEETRKGIELWVALHFLIVIAWTEQEKEKLVRGLKEVGREWNYEVEQHLLTVIVWTARKRKTGD